MRTVWKRIEDWLTLHASELGALLLKGATEEEILATEAAIGVEFPEEIKASYRLHNGVRFSFLSAEFIVGRYRLLSLTEMQEQWDWWHQPQMNLTDYSAGAPEDDWRKDIRAATERGYDLGIEGFDTKLVPLMTWQMGVQLCFDAARTRYASFGQLLTHDPESGLAFGAPSLQVFLSAFADDLEAGTYLIEQVGTYPRLRAVPPPPDETEQA